MWDNIYKFRVTFINVVLNIQMWDHTYKCGIIYTNVGPHMQMWDHTYVNLSHLQILQYTDCWYRQCFIFP